LKEVLAKLTPEQWEQLIHTLELAISGILITLGGVIAQIIVSIKNGQKIEAHTAEARARARLRGEPATPEVLPGDRRGV
jgi:hypothetical protein